MRELRLRKSETPHSFVSGNSSCRLCVHATKNKALKERLYRGQREQIQAANAEAARVEGARLESERLWPERQSDWREEKPIESDWNKKSAWSARSFLASFFQDCGIKEDSENKQSKMTTL